VGQYIRYLKTKKLPKNDVEARHVVCVCAAMWLDEKGRLYRNWWLQKGGVRRDTRQQLVVPQSFKDDLMRNAHDDLLEGHLM